jgi:hypothetical protein
LRPEAGVGFSPRLGLRWELLWGAKTNTSIHKQQKNSWYTRDDSCRERQLEELTISEKGMTLAEINSSKK